MNNHEYIWFETFFLAIIFIALIWFHKTNKEVKI